MNKINNTIGFYYKGVSYTVDIVAYDGNFLIKLPDGTIVRVGGWLESLPPQVQAIEELKWYEKIWVTLTGAVVVPAEAV